MNKLKSLYNMVFTYIMCGWTKLHGRDTFVINFGKGLYCLGERLKVNVEIHPLKVKEKK